jgi:hypothetical protein
MPLKVSSHDVSGRGFAQHDDGDIMLKMSQEDWSFLLFALGYFTGGREKESERAVAIEFINRINEGNPEFKPYKVKKEKK